MTGGAALVTGASRGIGAAIALTLGEAGFAVAANAPAEAAAELAGVVERLVRQGIRAVAVAGDIAAIDGHAALLDAAEGALGPLTTLVNNAGVSVLARGDLLDVTPESFDHCHAVNTRGTFFLTQAFARRLLARPRDPGLHHAIITISSSNAQAVSVNRGEYCISKAGLSMAARLFAVRLGAAGIGSYEVQPGLIETPMTAPSQALYRQRIAEGLTVVPRMGRPEDVATIVRALARGELAFCTGQAIQADGGLLIPRF